MNQPLDAPEAYICFDRNQWSQLRADVPLTLSQEDLQQLQGINEKLSLDEVIDVYLPLSRLLNCYVHASLRRADALAQFLKHSAKPSPFIITVAGSVAVGKSTTARILQALLSRWDEHPRVALVTTDGFLYPNAVLKEKGIMSRKGFPESYDQRRLLRFIADIKAGKASVSAPVYSHQSYDIVPGLQQQVEQPDILILEGLNVLQSGVDQPKTSSRMFVSDYVDFSIYVDAEPARVKKWYIERFLRLRQTAFTQPDSYFAHYARLSDDEAITTACAIWDSINGINLEQNIRPTKGRAHLVLHKGEDHLVDRVALRK